MSEDLKWIVGAFLAIAAFIGGILARDRQLSSMIARGDDRLHERINRVRDEYVRRDDLDGHIQRMNQDMASLRQEVQHMREENNRRLDALLIAVNGNKAA